jgi:hypothetical protein
MKSQAKNHQQMDTLTATYRPHEKSWNVLECYQHMNLYGDLYLSYFEEALMNSKTKKGEPAHRAGLLGGWSAKNMGPQEVGVRMPTKTFAKMNPHGAELDSLVIDRFIKQQDSMLSLFKRALSKDIDRVKTRTTLKFVRFKLSDGMHFFTNHNLRHMLQVERIIQSAQTAGVT